MYKLVHVTTVSESLGFLRGQLSFYKKKGFQVYAVSSPGNTLYDIAESEQVKAIAVPMMRRISPFHDIKSLVLLYCLFLRIRPHIVHAHTPKAGLLATIAAWLAGVPVRVYTIRGLPILTQRWPKTFILSITERIACTLATRVFCVSHSLMQVVLNKRLCPNRKIEVLLKGSGQGVDAIGRFNPELQSCKTRNSILQKWDVPSDSLVIGFVGRIVKDKGIHDLIEAWKVIKERFPKARLLLIGCYETADIIDLEVRDIIQKDSNICHVEWTYDVAAYYTVMDIVVLPTYREGFPNVPLEAASMKLPVVTTDVPGGRDSVINGVTGILIPPRDSGELAQAIIRLLENPDLRCMMGEAGRIRVLRDFRPEDIWKALAQEYSNLLVQKGSR